MKRVVITGMGALTPIGNNVNQLWDSAVKGVSGAALISKFDTTHFKTKFACELKDFHPLDYIDKSDLRKYDPYVQYSLITVEEAMRQADFDLSKLDKTRVGVIWGTGYGGFSTFEEQVLEFGKGNGVPRFNPYFILKTIPNMASGIISIKYGFQGINYTTVSACATSNTAIMDAFNYIRIGKADVIIAGGSEAAVTPASIGGFSAMKALSTRNDDPAAASRPFDTNRDGFVMGEGAGALILEEYEHAIKRNAPIIAELAGAAMTADAYHLTLTHPEGEGAYLGMKSALEDAELSSRDVDYVNMHATSTPAGDLSEMKAMQRIFQGSDHFKISATKSMTGHLLGAAGAVEAILCLKSIEQNIIPPTINTVNPDSSIPKEMNIVLGKALPSPVNVAMSNTFGFGGHNAIVIFKRFVK